MSIILNPFKTYLAKRAKLKQLSDSLEGVDERYNVLTNSEVLLKRLRKDYPRRNIILSENVRKTELEVHSSSEYRPKTSIYSRYTPTGVFALYYP